MNKLKCPYCNTENLWNFDNEPLYNDIKWLKENNVQFDNAIYMEFECENSHIFKKQLNIII